MLQAESSVRHPYATVSLRPNLDLPSDLIALDADRDVSATLFCIESALQRRLVLNCVRLNQGQRLRRSRYESFFGCRVEFDVPYGEFVVEAALLETPMPMNDANMATLCHLQCEKLMARLSRRSSVVDEIRWRILVDCNSH